MHARHAQAGHRPHSHHRFLLTFAYRTHARTLAIPRFAAIVVFLLIPVAAVIYLAATCYLIFHDDVLAGLMQHQADMQYAYEDRIAALKRDVENADQQAATAAADFTERLRDFSRRQDQVESRTALLATFAAEAKQMNLPAEADAPAEIHPTPTASIPSASTAAAAGVGAPDPAPLDGKPHPAGFDLRLQDGSHPATLPFSTSDAAPADDNVAQSPNSLARDLADRYQRTEATDLALLTTLERPADQLRRRVDDTLAAIGLSASRFHVGTHAPYGNTADGVGGPFVPLPILSDGSAFAGAAAHLQNALATAEDLKAVLPHIPLKAPLPGELEVTSPFGPRIDPFFGRPALHTGVDLHGTYGDSVYATAPGHVTFAARWAATAILSRSITATV